MERHLVSRYYLKKLVIPFEQVLRTTDGETTDNKVFRFTYDHRATNQQGSVYRSPIHVDTQRILRVRKARLYATEFDTDGHKIYTNLTERAFLHASFSRSNYNFVTAIPSDYTLIEKQFIYNSTDPIEIWFTSTGENDVVKFDVHPDTDVYTVEFIIELGLE